MHCDLGVIDDSLLLFGGPYSNLQATEAVLAQAARLGIKNTSLICTGDTVAYCDDPTETVAALRQSGAVVVAGNCEKQLASGAVDCGCGFEQGSVCALLSDRWFTSANSQIGEADRQWMRTCPDLVTFKHQGARYAVIHGGVTDVAQFVWPTSHASVFAQEWRALEKIAGPVDVVIAGHSGIPFLRSTAQGQWINAGVVGMPPHDGNQQTRYAVLDGGEVLFHRLSYDVEAACDAMRREGLTDEYLDALRSGYWPSEAILPEELRIPSFASG